MLNVTLPHGKSMDLDTVAVVRSVSQAESDAYNARLLEDLKKRPDYAGIVPSRRWTVALEVAGEQRVTTRYTDALTVKQLVEAAPEVAQRFELIDNGRSAIKKGARIHLIRPLQQRDDTQSAATGDNKAVIHVDGGSSSGLYVSKTAGDIKVELGARAGHLVQIGEEGFIDRTRIESVTAFDADKNLKPGQTRFAIAVRFKDVWRPQYFVASEATLRGAPVVDLRQAGDVQAGAAQAVRPVVAPRANARPAKSNG
jgi:hypothetical protein